MLLTTVTSTKLPQLQIYHQLRDASFREDNSFIADSPKVVNLLLETKIQIKSILATQEYYDTYRSLLEKREIPFLYVAQKAVIEEIIGHKLHHNCMLHGIRPDDTPLEALGEQIIMLDEITSTENIGSIARSAAAMGVKSYLIPQQGPHPFNRRALRVSMGLASHMKIHRYADIFETLHHLKKEGYTIFAAEVTDEAIGLSKIQIPEKWVLLMGHEGRGLSAEVLAVCDAAVVIEMEAGIKSFNVAVAASILLYQFVNR